MKDRILFFKLITFIFLISCFAFVKGQNQLELKDELLLKENMVNNQITVYLNRHGIIKDSLTFNNLNFVFDSLNRINNTLWLYIYSARCGSGCKFRMQIMLMSDNNKLRLAYVGYHSSSYDYRELYSNDLSINGYNNSLQYPIYSCVYTFVDSLTSTKPLIKEYIYKGKVPDKGNKGTTIYYPLKYDSIKKIYYTQKQSLFGEYTIVTSKNKKELKKKINTVVLALKFKETQWVYYNYTWYELNQKGKFLIKFE